MRAAFFLFDRTAVLFLGVAAGAAMGYAFGVHTATDPVAPPIEVGASDAATSFGGDRNPGDTPPARPGDTPRPTSGVLPEQPTVSEGRPIQPGIVNAIAAGRPVRVGVFGDSFGDGIWSALYNQLSRKQGYQVVKFSQQATGFTRYKTLNLEEHDRARLAPAPVDIAVISFGANDMMGVAANGHVYALLSPNWKAEIARRVTRYVAMLRGQGAIVYWVGLPKMREAAYDADIARMNAFYRDLMGQLGVAYIETAPYSVDTDGRYAAYLPGADGRQVLMRANDGIHMSMNGYVRITRGLAGRIRTYVDRARGEAGGDAAPPPPMVAPPPPPPAIVRVKPPKLEDPLASPSVSTSPPSAAEHRTPPAKGAPIDLLPLDLRGEDEGNSSE